MRTDVLQVVALCSHGNAYLRSGAEKPTELLGLNSTFVPVREICFERPGRMPGGGKSTARTVAQWLRKQKDEGSIGMCPSLLGCGPRPKEDNADPSGVVSDSDRGLEIWSPCWRARMTSYNDPAAYEVVYTASRYSRWMMKASKSPEGSALQILSALQSLVTYCMEVEDIDSMRLFERCIALQAEGCATLTSFQDGVVSEDETVKLLYATAVRSCTVVTSKSWISSKALDVEEGRVLTRRLWNSAMAALECAGSM